ncbi:MAG: glycosyltransferase family 9 protein [Dehalococcoidia bacterium]
MPACGTRIRTAARGSTPAAGARVCVTGTAAERDRTLTVLASMRAPAENLAGRLSLSGLTGLLSRSRVVVSNDTGPLYLAAAVGTPTVGIYWIVNLIGYGPLTRARHRPAVSWRTDCPTCGADQIHSSCNHTASIVADVPSDEVTASALDLFNQGFGHIEP